MRITFLPKTPLGRWSVGLAAASVLLIVLLVVLGAFLGIAVGEGRFQLVANTISVAIMVSGIGAFISALVSIIKSRERSILVFLVLILGFLVFLMELLEFLLPQ